MDASTGRGAAGQVELAPNRRAAQDRGKVLRSPIEHRREAVKRA